MGRDWDWDGIGKDDIQAKHTPEDDDVEVEDVCDSEGEAEDDAEDAGPEVVTISFCAEVLKLHRAHTIVRICLE
jgi:hypothetical protein